MKKKTAGKDPKAGKLVAVRTRGPDGKTGPLERAQLANQIQGFRIRTAQMLEKKMKKATFSSHVYQSFKQR